MRNLNEEIRQSLELALEAAQTGNKQMLAYFIAMALDELHNPEKDTQKEKVHY